MTRNTDTQARRAVARVLRRSGRAARRPRSFRRAAARTVRRARRAN